MKFEEFLKRHGDIHTKAMNGQTIDGESAQFLREINIVIETYSRIGNGIDSMRRRWLEEMNTLTHLREQITKLKEQSWKGIK